MSSVNGEEAVDPRRAALGRVPPVPPARRRPSIPGPPPRRPTTDPDAPPEPPTAAPDDPPTADRPTEGTPDRPSGPGDAPGREDGRVATGPGTPGVPPEGSPGGGARDVEHRTGDSGTAGDPSGKPGRRTDGDADVTNEDEDEEDDSDDAESYGTRKGNLTYVSTSIPRPLSDAFDRAADGTTLGVVLMRAVRAHHRQVREALTPEEHDPDDPFPPPQVRVYYRPPGGSIRRDIGVRPEEAAAIWRVAHDIGITPAAFMRMVLQRAFGPNDTDDPQQQPTAGTQEAAP